MKRTLFLTVVAGAMLAMGAWAMAADAPDGGPEGKVRPPGGMRGDPLKELNLTDEQKAKFKEIMEKAREDAEAADEPQEKRQIMQAAHEKFMKDVLTAEQREKLAKLRPPGPGGDPLRGLDLTDEQKAKVKEIMEKARKEAEAIMQAAREKIIKDVLTDEQREKLKKNHPPRPPGGPDGSPPPPPGGAE